MIQQEEAKEENFGQSLKILKFSRYTAHGDPFTESVYKCLIKLHVFKKASIFIIRKPVDLCPYFKKCGKSLRDIATLPGMR